MHEIKKIAKNSGFIIFGNIIDTVFNLLISISLVKYFGQSGFGKLSFLATFFFFMGLADNQWIRPILVREMSKTPNDSDRIIGNGLIIKTCIFILAIILFWITIWLVRPPIDVIRLAFFASISLLFTSIVSSYGIVFQVNLKMAYFAGFNLISKILTLISIYIVILWKGNLFHFYLLSLIPSTILLLQVKYYSEKIIKPVFKIDPELWQRIFKESWPLGLTTFFIFVYHRIDQIFLFSWKGTSAVGLYSAAVRLTESFNIVPTALMISVLPLMSKYYGVSKNNFERIYQLSFKYLLIFIVPVAVGISIFSDSIASIFYGKEFLSSGIALRILIWAEVFVFLGMVNNSILISAQKQILDPIFTGASAVVNIVLNFILIPKYSLVGAAIASLISYSVGPIMGYFIRPTHFYSCCMLRYSLRPIFASLLMGCFIYCMRDYFLISVIASPCIYLLILYFIKGISQDDIRIVKSVCRFIRA